MTENNTDLHNITYRCYDGTFFVDVLQEDILVTVSKHGNVVHSFRTKDVAGCVDEFERQVLEIIAKKETEVSFYAAVSAELATVVEERKILYETNGDTAVIP